MSQILSSEFHALDSIFHFMFSHIFIQPQSNFTLTFNSIFSRIKLHKKFIPSHCRFINFLTTPSIYLRLLKYYSINYFFPLIKLNVHFLIFPAHLLQIISDKYYNYFLILFRFHLFIYHILNFLITTTLIQLFLLIYGYIKIFTINGFSYNIRIL